MKTSTNFEVSIISRNPEYAPPMMSDDALYSKITNHDLIKITAPDGTYRLRRKEENHTIWDGFSDDARDIIDGMTNDQFAEYTAAIGSI